MYKIYRRTNRKEINDMMSPTKKKKKRQKTTMTQTETMKFLAVRHIVLVDWQSVS